MSLKFTKISVDMVDHIVRPDPTDDWVWVRVNVEMQDTADIRTNVRIEAPVPNDDGQPLSQFRDGGIAAARVALRAALDMLEGQSYADLTAKHRAFDKLPFAPFNVSET